MGIAVAFAAHAWRLTYIFRCLRGRFLQVLPVVFGGALCPIIVFGWKPTWDEDNGYFWFDNTNYLFPGLVVCSLLTCLISYVSGIVAVCRYSAEPAQVREKQRMSQY